MTWTVVAGLLILCGGWVALLIIVGAVVDTVSRAVDARRSELDRRARYLDALARVTDRRAP